MKKNVFLLFIILAGCNDSSDLTVEEKKNLDKKMMALDVPDFSNSKAKINQKDSNLMDLKNHPLSAYFNPEDYRIMNYFGQLYYHCDQDKPHRKHQCDQKIKQAIIKAEKAGISVSENDFRNPAFLRKQLEVLNAAKDKTRSFENLSSVERMKARNSFEELARKNLDDFKNGKIK